MVMVTVQYEDRRFDDKSDSFIIDVLREDLRANGLPLDAVASGCITLRDSEMQRLELS